MLACCDRLAHVASLRELWVQNNGIRDLAAATNALKGLPKLRKVVFKPNPCCAEPEDEKISRMYLLSQLRGLEFLDGAIANGERDDADAYLQTDAGKEALQSLLDRMKEPVARQREEPTERQRSRGRQSKSRERSRTQRARGDDQEEPERARGTWTRSAPTSSLNTRRGAQIKKEKVTERGELVDQNQRKGKGKAEPDEMKERRGGWGRGAVGGATSTTFERRKKAAEKPSPSLKPKERSTPSAGHPVSRHERTSAEIAAGVAVSAEHSGGEEVEDDALAHAKRLLNGLQTVPIVDAAADLELEKENTPADGVEAEGDPTLANAKRLLAGLQAAGLGGPPTTADSTASGDMSPLVPTPPRRRGASSTKTKSPARSSCSGDGMSIMDAVASLAEDPVPGTFLDNKRLFTNKRSGSRNGHGRGSTGRGGGRTRGGRRKEGPSPTPKEERLKRHSAPEKGTAPPEQQQAGVDRPGTGGLTLPSLPSAGGAQFVLRYEPKRRAGQQRVPAASSRTLRLSRPRGESDDLAATADAASGAGPVGVVVRHDGSATAKYPNGSLAVSIDPDGFDYEGRPMYRLYAGFRKDGKVACSFDSAGNGFANFGATGRTCFTHNTDSGGFSMATDGGMEHAWSGDAGTRGGSTEMLGSGSANDGDGEAADSPVVIVKQLDEHLLLRYSTDPAVPTALFFRCGSVKHKFVHGKNPTMETWDPDDEFLFAERPKKKKRYEKTFDLPTGHVLPSAKSENEPYTNEDRLQDIVRNEWNSRSVYLPVPLFQRPAQI